MAERRPLGSVRYLVKEKLESGQVTCVSKDKMLDCSKSNEEPLRDLGRRTPISYLFLGTSTLPPAESNSIDLIACVRNLSPPWFLRFSLPLYQQIQGNCSLKNFPNHLNFSPPPLMPPSSKLPSLI